MGLASGNCNKWWNLLTCNSDVLSHLYTWCTISFEHFIPQKKQFWITPFLTGHFISSRNNIVGGHQSPWIKSMSSEWVAISYDEQDWAESNHKDRHWHQFLSLILSILPVMSPTGRISTRKHIITGETYNRLSSDGASTNLPSYYTSNIANLKRKKRK
jgi:hypothetical protein